MDDKKLAAIASAFVAGDGTPRIREQIVRDLTTLLKNTYMEGLQVGISTSRANALREVLSLTTGMRNAFESYDKLIERELIHLETNKK